MSVNPRVSLKQTHHNIGRLTQAGADTFAYDKAGNNQNDNAIYNILNNQLTSSDIYTITYDAIGNIKSKHNKLTNTTSKYTFNSRNQLVSYEQLDDANQTTKTLTYTYDAFNRRVSKTEDGVEQKYLYDGDDIVAILDSNNQVIATITHDESIDTPLSITNSNGTFYYHRDHQGSIVALTDTTGQVVESFTYDNHYGTIINHTKTTETNNPYAYTGRELDTDELYYYRARYYDPTTQRFLSQDPIEFEAGDFNFYRYVGGDPVNFVDPTGLVDENLIPTDTWMNQYLHNTMDTFNTSNAYSIATHGFGGWFNGNINNLADNAKNSGKSEILLIACQQGDGEMGNMAQDLANLSNMPVQYTTGNVNAIPFIGPFTFYPHAWHYIYPRLNK